MYRTSEHGIDHSKNRFNAVRMEMQKKGTSVANSTDLFIQLLNLRLPNVKEASFKADKVKLPGFEASGVEYSYKFHDTNPKVRESQETKKGKTIWDKLWLFVVKQSITAYFQIFIKSFPRFLP
jgi:hypothetical protein